MIEKGTINIVGDYSKDADTKIDPQRTVNMYIRETPEGKSERSLVPMFGRIRKHDFSGDVIIRDLYTYKENLYTVSSDRIYKITPTLTVTNIGTIGSAFGYIGTSSNINQIIWVDGGDGYIYNTSTSTFSTISSPGFPSNPTDVAFLDGYFIVIEGNTNKWNISELNNGLSWDALNFESIESKPDVLIGVRTLHRRLFLFGKVSTEIWYNAGASDFPFRRDNNLLLEYGCAAANSIASGYQRLFWLSGDENGVGSVVMTDGTTPVIVSTPAIDYAIQQYSKTDDAIANISKKDGHVFYELTFPTANHTWVYDATTNKWFEAEELNGDRSIVNCRVFFNGNHYMGASNEASLFEESPIVYTNDGDAIKRERICGHFSEPHYRQIVITRLTIDIVAGVGLGETNAVTLSTEYADPSIFVSWSKDGGVSFGGRRKASLGRYGNRLDRAIIRRLGKARDWVFKIEVVCKSKVIILGASIDYKITGR